METVNTAADVPTPHLWTPRQLAQRWRVSARTLDRIVGRGIVTPLRLGARLRRFRIADILAAEGAEAVKGEAA